MEGFLKVCGTPDKVFTHQVKEYPLPNQLCYLPCNPCHMHWSWLPSCSGMVTDPGAGEGSVSSTLQHGFRDSVPSAFLLLRETGRYRGRDGSDRRRNLG